MANAEGYPSRHYDVPTKRYVQVMDLNADNTLIALYRQAHDKDHFWKEIGRGIKAVGIMEMEIYIAGNHLVMIVDAPLDFCWDDAMARLATMPRQAEWEAYVAQWQQCDPAATSDEKWHMTERMFWNYEF